MINIETIETVIKLFILSFTLTYSLWYIGNALDFVFAKIFRRELDEV